MARINKRRPGSARELAARLGISPRAVRRYIAEPRALYEASAATKGAPWQLEGISRATWYRRQKRQHDKEQGGCAPCATRRKEES
jgi:predicted ArsR family transcriptional regulator